MRLAILGCALLALAACDTALFSQEAPVERLEPAPERIDQDNRTAVRSVTSARKDRLPGGVVVTATGLPDHQGHWDAELILLTREGPVNGDLIYEFRVADPVVAGEPGTTATREVVVARFVSDTQLEGVRRIVITGERNQRSVRP